MIKMTKDHTERKNVQWMKDLQNIKFFGKKLVSVHSPAPPLANVAIFYSRPFRPTDLP